MEQSFRLAGQLGRDLARVDWERTPLGDPSSWPKSLETTVRMLLTSKFSMWMAWGPELTFFCNDAYRRDTLGRKYPWALGRPAREVWSEIWPEIGPRIETVLRTGESTWDEKLQLFLERSGYLEETYHTFSYSPLADDSGAVIGILCVVTEVTEEVVGQRRIRTLSALGSLPVEAVTVQDTLDALADTLHLDEESLPFTLTYLHDEHAQEARLAATSGFKGPHPVAPAGIALDDAQPVWPVRDLLAGHPRVLEGLDERFDGLPTGAWPEPPTRAYAVPLVPGAGARPMGFLVVGLNRYRRFDHGYQTFLHLVAGQVVASLARARAFETERERARELERLDRAKTAFFTNVSHELRTPLTLLLGPAEDALEDREEPLGARQRARLDVVLRNGHRLLKLVNTLLDFSRLESDESASTFTPVDLAAVTHDVATLFEPAASHAGLTFTVDARPLPQPVYVDRELWAKAVLNLLSNALKFTFSGSVSVTLEDVGGMAELRVSDTGIGIAEADQAELFKRFHRVLGARSRSHEGTGVGLALVADIAARHGGRVAVDSEPGRGSTFVLRLPYGSEHLPAERLAAADAAGLGQEAARGYLEEAMHWLDAPERTSVQRAGEDRPRVLVVDDNVDMRRHIAGLLAHDYVVDSAADGVEALARLRENVPDLVVTDVMMPRLDGFGLLRALHEQPETTGVPVLMISARAGDEGAVEGLEAGADDYLMKPFTSRELLARVRANLELDRVRRTRNALERSQTLLHEAQRLAQVGSWEVDLATGRLSASAELLRIIGVTEEQLAELRFPALTLQLVHPEDVPRAEEAIAAALGGVSATYQARVVRRDDGRTRLVRVRVEARHDDDGTPVALLGSLQDITEQEQAQQEVAVARAAQEAAAREHSIAEELQRSLLPIQEFDVEHLEIATFYRAGVEGTQVGGDWYDVIDLGAGRAALVIGDVMGRGVRAAAVMGQLRSAVRAYARLDMSPAQVLHHLDGIVRDLGATQIVTCVYAVFDPRDQVLTIGNAGHLPPLLALPGQQPAPLVTVGGPPLGAGPARFGEERVQMVHGATLALYTDGLVERRGSDLDDGLDALARELGRWRGDARGLPEALVEALLPEGQDDDVAVLVARMEVPEGSTVLSRRLPADVSAARLARELVAEGLGRCGVPAETTDDVVLVTSELVSNAVEHGAPPIELQVRTSGENVVLEVRDGRVEEPVARIAGGEDERGRGLRIVEALSVRWGCRTRRTGKSVWCVLRPSAD